MNGIDTPQTAAREEYHVQIYKAMCDLRQAIDSIGALRNRIQEGDAPKNAEQGPDAPVPSLNGFLQGTAGDIAQEVERLRKLRDEIRNLLF